MKKMFFIRLILFVAIISALSTLTSCKKEYVVKPEDIQAYLEKGADLTIILPEMSSFDLINVEGQRLQPGMEVLESAPETKPTPADSAANNGANGEKKFRHAGAFIQNAYAAGGSIQMSDSLPDRHQNSIIK